MNRLQFVLILLGTLAAMPAFANDTVYYYHTDAQGTAVVVTDANHNVVERTYYGPYGEVLNRALRDGPGYTGHEEDAATGLDNMQQRYYDPVTGRFPSVDPMPVDTTTGANFNRYAYANDNPYRFTDPDGRAATQAAGRVADQTCSTGTHLSGQGCAGMDVRVTQLGSPSVSEAKAAAAAALAIRMGAGATSTAAGAGGAAAADTLLGGVAAGALVYPSATASDDTLSAQAAKELDKSISSFDPQQEQYIYRISGGWSPQLALLGLQLTRCFYGWQVSMLETLLDCPIPILARK